jgi:hypothetical protein
MDADLGQRSLVLGVHVVIEQNGAIGGAVKPAVGLDLKLQLAGRPSGIAKRQNSVIRALAFRNGAQDLERSGQADAVRNGQRCAV